MRRSRSLRFSSARLDFFAPKRSSPRLITVRVARSTVATRRASAASSLAHAMKALVSKRSSFPGIGINPLAFLLYGLSYFLSVLVRQSAEGVWETSFEDGDRIVVGVR